MTSSSRSAAFHSVRPIGLAPLNRAYALLHTVAAVAVIRHRLSTPIAPIFILLLLLADLVLFLGWLTAQAFRWRPVRRREFPDRLLREVKPQDFPALDAFICTADPRREPTVSVASTALSAMAFDYPADKLSVYVSDDGGSAVTLFALAEAARFARYWLPFCRENGVAERSPEVYFASNDIGADSEKIRVMYQTMSERVEIALERGYVGNDRVNDEEDLQLFQKWKGFTRHDHPTIIKVLLENGKDSDIAGNPLPNLIYVSREKRPTAHHHFKAGALNVLTRVSSAMTDAPIVLTLDCDMSCSNPRSPLHALCYFLDSAFAADLSFVQFPQRFRGVNGGDIYASEMKRLFTIHPRGMDGLRGPDYAGTGCFFARRSLHSSPLLAPQSPLSAVYQLAGCTYEDGTKWGASIGFRYGSLVEDFNTGYLLQCEGWKSVFCDPERPAFLADVPKNLNDVLSQCKRWVVGLHEVGFSRHNPLIFGTTKASFLMGLCYAYYTLWGFLSVPMAVYGLLPQLTLVHQKPLFPKASDPWFYLYAFLFLGAYGQDLADFLADGAGVRRWWSDQRLWMMRGLTSFLLGSIQFGLNQVGVSAPGFNVTSKVMEEEQTKRYEEEEFYFGVESPMFAVLGAVACVNLSSLVVGLARAAAAGGGFDQLFAQLFLSAFVTANCWPIYKAMFVRTDEGRMTGSVTVAALAAAALLHWVGYVLFHGSLN